MATQTKPSANRKAGEGLKVLVIDDEAFHAETVAARAGARRLRLHRRHQRQGRRQQIESDEFDLILTDLKMNDLDGLAILRKAREDLPDAEVIMITGHGDVKTAVEAIKEGAANYLTKPIDKAELEAIVAKAAERLQLDAHQPRAETAARREVRLRGRDRQQPEDARGHQDAARASRRRAPRC